MKPFEKVLVVCQAPVEGFSLKNQVWPKEPPPASPNSFPPVSAESMRRRPIAWPRKWLSYA